MDDYDAIIQNQLEEGIVEKAEMAATGMELYIPHKAVVRENAESTKLRIVYDASARGNDSAPSLNDCLEVAHRYRTSYGKSWCEEGFMQSP